MLDNPKETEEIKMRKVKVFSGSSHPQLAQLIFDRLGVQGSPVNFLKQTNGELNISFDCSVREEDVYIIQSGSNAVNDDLMELLIMVNAAKVSSASRITVVMPYLPYSKQSKKKKARGTVVSKLIANMLQTAGVDHIITIDLHSTLIPGFFSSPVDNIPCRPLFKKFITENYDINSVVIVAKNAGATKRVTELSDALDVDFALIHREKYHIDQIGDAMESRISLVGNVKDKICFLMDDIVDSPKSFIDACIHLKHCGAAKTVILGCHGVLSGNAVSLIQESNDVDEIIVTNTYPMALDVRNLGSKLRVIDVSGVLAEAIRRTHNGESISYLFHTAI